MRAVASPCSPWTTRISAKDKKVAGAAAWVSRRADRDRARRRARGSRLRFERHAGGGAGGCRVMRVRPRGALDVAQTTARVVASPSDGRQAGAGRHQSVRAAQDRRRTHAARSSSSAGPAPRRRGVRCVHPPRRRRPRCARSSGSPPRRATPREPRRPGERTSTAVGRAERRDSARDSTATRRTIRDRRARTRRGRHLPRRGDQVQLIATLSGTLVGQAIRDAFVARRGRLRHERGRRGAHRDDDGGRRVRRGWQRGGDVHWPGPRAALLRGADRHAFRAAPSPAPAVRGDRGLSAAPRPRHRRGHGRSWCTGRSARWSARAA